MQPPCHPWSRHPARLLLPCPGSLPCTLGAPSLHPWARGARCPAESTPPLSAPSPPWTSASAAPPAPPPSQRPASPTRRRQRRPWQRHRCRGRRQPQRRCEGVGPRAPATGALVALAPPPRDFWAHRQQQRSGAAPGRLAQGLTERGPPRYFWAHRQQQRSWAGPGRLAQGLTGRGPPSTNRPRPALQCRRRRRCHLFDLRRPRARMHVRAPRPSRQRRRRWQHRRRGRSPTWTVRRRRGRATPRPDGSTPTRVAFVPRRCSACPAAAPTLGTWAWAGPSPQSLGPQRSATAPLSRRGGAAPRRGGSTRAPDAGAPPARAAAADRHFQPSPPPESLAGGPGR